MKIIFTIAAFLLCRMAEAQTSPADLIATWDRVDDATEYMIAVEASNNGIIILQTVYRVPGGTAQHIEPLDLAILPTPYLFRARISYVQDSTGVLSPPTDWVSFEYTNFVNGFSPMTNFVFEVR